MKPSTHSLLHRFLFPRLTRKRLLRFAIVVTTAWFLFSFVLIPMRTRGKSMEPTYADGGFNFCFRPRFLIQSPQRHDIVVVRLTGKRVFYLKRIVGLPGEEIAFVDGQLIVNRTPLDEPYVRGPCDWNLPPRTVKPNHYYVVGDNRSVPMDQHIFGQTASSRLIGGPLW